jgi:hypothetical protein
MIDPKHDSENEESVSDESEEWEPQVSTPADLMILCLVVAVAMAGFTWLVLRFV